MKEFNLKSEITNFLTYLTVERGCSAVTIKNYKGHLNNLAKFIQEKELSLNLIREYRNYLANQNLSKPTQNAYLIALRSLLKYLTKMNILMLPLDCIELIKVGERQVKTLLPTQINYLLSRPKMYKLRGIRDRAILEVLFATGLRVSELCSLNKADINFKSGEFAVLGKGGRVRPIFVSQRASKWLHNYLFHRKDSEMALFVTIKRPISRIQVRSVQKLVKKYVIQAELDKITPHALRHLFACDLLSNGADLRSIQELLGHKNLASTQVYTHVTNPQLKKTYLQFHGKELWL